MWLYIVLPIIALILGFFAIILIRALLFKPKKEEIKQVEKIEFDKDKAVYSLGELIKCKTVSSENSELEDEKEFNKLLSLLPKLYPFVYEKCELKTFGGRGLLFKLKGKTDDKPSILMSHYDVVSVVEENWEKPPFDAVLEDGVLWGRGALDTKVTFNAVMFSINTLLSSGFVPNADIYLAFSGSEEVNGEDARNIVNYFIENKIEPEMVVDEGGAVVTGVFPGVKNPCGLVGIAEKGLMNVSYTAKSSGGHASAPKPNSPVVRLSKACTKIENKPFKYHITKPVKELFDTLGRHSTFLYRIIFANLWLFKGLVNKMAVGNGGDMNALLRTTVAFTKFDGSKGFNVIPPVATMVSNIRINPEDNKDFVLSELKKKVNDDKVEISELIGENPSNISRTDVIGYDRVKNAIKATWGNDVLVSPYLMVQCSDSRHYSKFSDRVYRFSACDLTNEERASIHGNNERIRVETIHRSIEFYLHLIKEC